MRPSLSVTLEPDLERGVPWGRDLYTFVTSAAGHMMRTLQKPRKSRPSKRQVNHRRFLQNMIQRKFADIEAANHRLSSAVIYKEKENSILCLLSQKPETLDQSGTPSKNAHLQEQDESNLHTGADDINKPRRGPDETEVREEKHSDPGYLQKQHPESQPSTNITRKNNQRKGGQRKEKGNHKLVDFTSTSTSVGPDFHHRSELFNNESFIDECKPAMTYNYPEDSQKAHEDFSSILFGQNGDVSPELSPLSLNSCDLSLQMFRDVLTQTNVTDISESQWTDLIDLFSVGSKDLSHVEVEAYLESICAFQGDDGQESCVNGAGFSDQSGGFMQKICSHRSEIEADTGEHRYECGYFYREDQGMKSNHCQRQHNNSSEIQFVNTFKPAQGSYIIHNQLSTSISYDYSPSDLQMYHHPREETPCMLIGDENKQNLTLFEGIAQSFSVPLLNPEHRSIPTPPHEDDWLFTDILKDRKTPY